MEFNDGITSTEHKSCATMTVQCLADSGVCTWDTAFNMLISNAKKMGLMPDDFKVIRETLQQLGFFMQSTAIEDIHAKEAVAYLGNLGTSAIVFLQMADYMHLGGYMVALKAEGNKYVPIRAVPSANYFEKHRVLHTWIHWKDGVDRSPFPRKTVKRKTGVSQRRTFTETDCYKPYQPNPRGNNIGDCVVRATAGAMDISWNEAIDVLSSMHETTVNAREVFPQILANNGFVHYNVPTKNGHRLDGKSFCDEMNRTYRKGERIFASVGRSHVAAIVPSVDDNGRKSYKIIDSWDSSKRLIGEYWVLPVKEADSGVSKNKTEELVMSIGDLVRHPTFGEGTIIDVTSSILTIDFGVNALRRLSRKWVLNHCVPIVAKREECMKYQEASLAER